MARRSLPGDKSGYLSEDTIAAALTPGGGAISVIRISGPGAFGAVERLSSEIRVSELEPRRLHRARLIGLDGQPIDDALAVHFIGPRSFTGEDVVELHLHGGTFIATRVMEALRFFGIRQALPGEFSFRAVRNGKISLSQAEGIADLIAARNDNAVSLALEKMSGTQSKLISELAEELRNLASLGEVGIDFSDQDVDEVSLPALRRRLEPVISRLDRLRSSFSRGIRIQEGIRVAFVGLPNSGKSSFFNALLGEDRSIVSDIAGTTRDLVRETLSLRGTTASVTLRLEDTAGLRQSEDYVERMGIERTQRAAREADLLLLLIEATAGKEQLEALFQQWVVLGQPKTRTLGVITKCDLSNGNIARDLLVDLGRFELDQWLETSAITGFGISEAGEKIADFCEKWVQRDPGEILLTRLEHLSAVEGSLGHLERAMESTEIELLAADLRQALFSLEPLIGETLPDDILGRIFSKFCIGK